MPKHPEPSKPARNAKGHFVKGNQASRGNKGGGRPASAVVQARDAYFAGKLAEADRVFGNLLTMPLDKAIETGVVRDQLRAAEIVMAYVYGRPRQAVEVRAAFLDLERQITEAEAAFVAQALASAKED